MINIRVDGYLTAEQSIEVLKLSSIKRKRIMGQISRKMRVNSRQRLRDQKDLSGKPFTPRKNRKNKRKMLRKIGQKIITIYNDSEAKVTYTPAAMGVASAHQYGVDITMTAEKAQRRKGEPDTDSPATKYQAVALKREGFKQRRKGARPFKPTISWIRENLKVGQAGLILRAMRDSPAKKSWLIHLPARSHLGATNNEIYDMVQIIVNNTINAKV